MMLSKRYLYKYESKLIEYVHFFLKYENLEYKSTIFIYIFNVHKNKTGWVILSIK